MAIPSALQNQNYNFSDLVTKVSRLEAPSQDTDQRLVLKKKRTVRRLDETHTPQFWWQNFQVKANENMEYYGLPHQDLNRYKEDAQNDMEDEYFREFFSK